MGNRFGKKKKKSKADSSATEEPKTDGTAVGADGEQTAPLAKDESTGTHGAATPQKEEIQIAEKTELPGDEMATQDVAFGDGKSTANQETTGLPDLSNEMPDKMNIEATAAAEAKVAESTDFAQEEMKTDEDRKIIEELGVKVSESEKTVDEIKSSEDATPIAVSVIEESKICIDEVQTKEADLDEVTNSVDVAPAVNDVQSNDLTEDEKMSDPMSVEVTENCVNADDAMNEESGDRLASTKHIKDCIDQQLENGNSIIADAGATVEETNEISHF